MKDSLSLGGGGRAGEIHSKTYCVGSEWESNLKNLYSTAPSLSSNFIIQRQPPEINRKTKLKLVCEVSSTSFATQAEENNFNLIELRKHLACPPGCSFLGAKMRSLLSPTDSCRIPEDS